MAWLKLNWRWAALNLFAIFVLVVLLGWGSRDWADTRGFDLMLESGKWAIRWLLFCLAMTPLRSYFGWNGAIKLRKPAGLWAFGFGGLHLLVYLGEAGVGWLDWSLPLYLALGLLGLLILAALAFTSNRWSMQRLGKSWKRLHRLVYLAGTTVIFHAMLATTMSKRIPLRDPQVIQELQFYLGLLAVLLIVRIPLVRRLLKQVPALLQAQSQVELPVAPVTPPDQIEIDWSQIYEREIGIPLDDLSVEISPEEEGERQQVIAN